MKPVTISAAQTIKVQDLTLPQVDYWVAKAEGLEVIFGLGRTHVLRKRYADGDSYDPYDPTVNWALAGPIIAREKICWDFLPEGYNGCPYDRYEAGLPGFKWAQEQVGKTQLEAAMRAYVVSRFGLEVEAPVERYAK